MCKWAVEYTPENKRREPKHEGLEDDFPFQRMIFRFHVSFLGGVTQTKKKNAFSSLLKWAVDLMYHSNGYILKPAI